MCNPPLCIIQIDISLLLTCHNRNTDVEYSIIPQIVDKRAEEVIRMRNETDISALLSVRRGCKIIFKQRMTVAVCIPEG